MSPDFLKSSLSFESIKSVFTIVIPKSMAALFCGKFFLRRFLVNFLVSVMVFSKKFLSFSVREKVASDIFAYPCCNHAYRSNHDFLGEIVA